MFFDGMVECSDKTKTHRNYGNINYDDTKQGNNLVAHIGCQIGRRQLLQRRIGQVWQAHRHGCLAQPYDHLRCLRPAKHQEHVSLDRIRRRMVQRFAQRTRHNAQMLRRRNQGARLRRRVDQRRQADEPQQLRKERKERKNSKFNNR